MNINEQIYALCQNLGEVESQLAPLQAAERVGRDVVDREAQRVLERTAPESNNGYGL